MPSVPVKPKPDRLVREIQAGKPHKLGPSLATGPRTRLFPHQESVQSELAPLIVDKKTKMHRAM